VTDAELTGCPMMVVPAMTFSADEFETSIAHSRSRQRRESCRLTRCCRVVRCERDSGQSHSPSHSRPSSACSRTCSTPQ
jgi:hypothetical protein